MDICSKRYLVAFEFWDINALQMFKKHATPKAVMEKEYPFYVLIETSGSNKDHDDEVFTMQKIGEVFFDIGNNV